MKTFVKVEIGCVDGSCNQIDYDWCNFLQRREDGFLCTLFYTLLKSKSYPDSNYDKVFRCEECKKAQIRK